MTGSQERAVHEPMIYFDIVQEDVNLVPEIQELPHVLISEISAFHGRLKWMVASVTIKVSYADEVIAAQYCRYDDNYGSSFANQGAGSRFVKTCFHC